jgi:hypothetical protein
MNNMKNKTNKINIVLLTLAILLIFGAAVEQIAAQTKKSTDNGSKTDKSKQIPRPSAHSKKTPAMGVALLQEPPSTVSSQREVIPVFSSETSGNIEFPPISFEKQIDTTLSGNLTIEISANENTVIKIGLAERAVVLIDFPVNDPVYKIHPGNENFVTVGCAGRESNGKCLDSPTDALVLRPGKDFHALGSEESAATVITVQRVSGLVVSFLVVPVKKISDNTNYLAVHYLLDDVLRSRKSSGLPSNLKPGGEKFLTVKNSEEIIDGSAVPKTVEDLLDGNQNPTQKPSDEPPSLESRLVGEIKRISDSKPSLKFSKPLNGLSLARASDYGARVNDVTIEVVAIRNTTPYPLRLVPEQPTLFVENKDKKQISINIERVNLLYTATTVEDLEVLEPGRIYYFAFAYQSPILGVSQLLRVNFAHREAADAPASLELSGGNNR